MEENGQTLVTFGSPKLYFPSDVFKWIKQNANPKMALKLMKVCKYFQHANGFPFFVVKSILLFDSTWTLNTLDNEEITAESIIPNKLWWIIGNITIYPSPTAVANLLLKTVVINIQTLTLDGQNITMGEFKLLTDGGMIENFDSRQSAITDENGEIVPLEHIIQCLPNARYIRLNKSFLIKGAAEAKVSSKLEQLTLVIDPNDFKIETLFAFIKNNQKIEYTIWFCGISNDYSHKYISPSVKKVIQGWSRDYQVPRFFHCEENDPTDWYINSGQQPLPDVQ